MNTFSNECNYFYTFQCNNATVRMCYLMQLLTVLVIINNILPTSNVLKIIQF